MGNNLRRCPAARAAPRGRRAGVSLLLPLSGGRRHPPNSTMSDENLSASLYTVAVPRRLAT
ncbi:hypothetical protein MY11210_003903 [Beauveria gryllotalpidicola]